MKRVRDYFAQFDAPTEVVLIGPQWAPSVATLPKEKESPIIFVDGGARFRQKEEGFSVGDADSYLGKLDEMLPPCKDFNDLSYPLRFLPDSVQVVYFLGFLGGRRDHEMANLGEAHALLCRDPKKRLKIFMDEEVIGFSAGEWTLEHQGLFSLMTLAATTLELTGACKYPLSAPTTLSPLSSHGLSNHARGLLKLKADGPFFFLKQTET